MYSAFQGWALGRVQVLVSPSPDDVQLGQLSLNPPRLGSKCGKRVERFSDFGKYKGNFRNHTTSLPSYRTLSQVWGGSTSADLAVISRRGRLARTT